METTITALLVPSKGIGTQVFSMQRRPIDKKKSHYRPAR